MQRQPSLDSYRIERRLAEGGMGVVYEATHTQLGRHVAIKVLHAHVAAQPEALERFRREAQVLARLEHPHAVRVYDFVQGAEPYLVMEMVDGISLAERLERDGRLGFEEAAAIASQTLDVLEAAHAQGIIHRDLKPANLMLDASRPPPFVRVVDFGIALLQGPSNERLTQAGQVPGTAAYMSPEQVNGEALDARSDVYSLACVLFELLTGRPPFVAASPVHVLSAHLFREPPMLEEIASVQVPPRWQAALRKALSKPRQARFESARAFRDALQASASFESRGDSERSPAIRTPHEFIAAQADDPPVALVDLGASAEERELLQTALAGVGAQVTSHPEGAAVALVLGSDSGEALRVCELLLTRHPRLALLLCGPEDDLSLMTRAIEKGVFDYMPQPLDGADVARKVVRALKARRHG
jgi:serine/threonine-protein kinase